MCVVICTLTVGSSLRLKSKFPFNFLCCCSRDAFPSSKVVSGLAYSQQDHPWGTAGSGLLLESKPLHPFPSEMGRFHSAAGNGSLPRGYGYVHGRVLRLWDMGPPHQQVCWGTSLLASLCPICSPPLWRQRAGVSPALHPLLPKQVLLLCSVSLQKRWVAGDS